MSAYLYLMKMRVLTFLAYRFETFSSIVSNIIIMFATVFFWKVAYNGTSSYSGVDEKQMITYSIVAILLGTVFDFSVENIVNERVREGEVAVDFIKPVNVFGMYFAQDVGNIFCNIMQKAMPLILIVLACNFVPMPKSMGSLLLFLASCVQSALILWFLSAIVGLSSFWIIELGPLSYVKNTMVRILSGSIIPIWFFPQAFQKVLDYLPFVYIYQLPLGIFIGKTGYQEALKSILIQFLWLVLIIIAFLVLMRNARKNLLVQGG